MIKTLTYENKLSGWRLHELRLSSLTLLVGVSGAGKTRILYAINGLGRIAQGDNYPGRAWSVTFSVDEEDYTWSGEFAKAESPIGDLRRVYDEAQPDEEQGKLVRECLVGPAGEIFSRAGDEILFKGNKVPKLPSEKSLMATLKEEEAVRPVQEALAKIVMSFGSRVAAASDYLFSVYQPAKLLKTFKSIEDLNKSSLRVLDRLYLSQHMNESSFVRVKEQFMEVFPNVEDIRIEINDDADQDLPPGSTASFEVKERGVEGWIDPTNLSSGMLRTLLHLSELILLPKGTILLIDEFENSLGVNCIDVVTEELIQASNRMQFVITSHHPYVISNVGVDYWRVVTRKGSDVEAIPATKLGIGKSSHDSFLQLINARAYNQGVLFQ